MRSLPALLALLLAGCGGVSLWPFGGSGGGTELSRAPKNATEYRCDGGRSFWVRNLEDGAVWLIAPDREIRLARAAAAGRYSAGRVVLELSGDEASLADPPASFSGCKRAPKN
jgi:membrane-bound inhibitor of C-type lysozyme